MSYPSYSVCSRCGQTVIIGFHTCPEQWVRVTYPQQWTTTTSPYPCNAGTNTPIGYHHYETNPQGVTTCRFCGKTT